MRGKNGRTEGRTGVMREELGSREELGGLQFVQVVIVRNGKVRQYQVHGQKSTG